MWQEAQSGFSTCAESRWRWVSGLSSVGSGSVVLTFGGGGGTVPQRLLMMNGELVNGKAKEDLLNASAQIAMAARDDRSAVETAYLCVLTRRPTDRELDHFTARLSGTTGDERQRRLADLFWTLFNSTELSWNH